MSYTIMDIENAIISALRAEFGVGCRVAPYAGEVDELLGNVQQLTVQAPAVFVVYGGSRFSETANNSYDDELLFSIIHVAQDLRGGADLKAGAYGMLETSKAALIGKNLGLDIEPLHPVSSAALLIARTLNIYGFDVTTSYSLD